MIEIRGVIFDLDGVIVSTDELHYKAWKQMCEVYGMPFSRSTNELLRGVSRINSASIIYEKAGVQAEQKEIEAFAVQKNTLYVGMLNSISPLDKNENILNVLAWLKERGIKLAIGSSSKNARTILKRLELLSEFDVIVDGNDIKNSKPHPEVFATAVKALMLLPIHCLVVEDADAGIMAAKAAKCIAVAYRNNTSAQADYSITRIEQIKGLICC